LETSGERFKGMGRSIVRSSCARKERVSEVLEEKDLRDCDCVKNSLWGTIQISEGILSEERVQNGRMRSKAAISENCCRH